MRGREEALQQPAIAIVGSRNASAAGVAFADRLARGLGQAGYVVVSGLARGIDLRAHVAALETGTIGVLAGGHAQPYPPEAIPLIPRIAEYGAVVSEMPIEWEPRGRDFPRRNRIVSGLSLGVVVVEAARGSGSLITARFAGEQNREVFAVPGSPLDPRAEGANDLLRDGAHICARVEDVLGVIDPVRERDPFADFREDRARGRSERAAVGRAAAVRRRSRRRRRARGRARNSTKTRRRLSISARRPRFGASKACWGRRRSRSTNSRAPRNSTSRACGWRSWCWISRAGSNIPAAIGSRCCPLERTVGSPLR